MTLGRLWAFLAVGMPVLAAFIANLSAVDLAYHVRAGGELLDTGRIPVADTWTFTATGAPWLNQQWGAQLVLAAVYRAASWTGLAIVRAALVGVTFGLLYEAVRRRGLDLRRAAWLTLGAFVVSAVALALRPQLFGMALMALTLLVVVDRRAHPRRLWLTVPIVAVWANVHGSFFLGPVVVGLAWLEDVHDHRAEARRTLLVALAAGLASLLNPFTIDVWRYAAGLSTNAFVTNRISEWQPTTLRTIPGILFFGSAGLAVLALVRRGPDVGWPTFAWLAVFAAIGAYAIRGVAWWPLGAAVAVAPLLARDAADSGSPRPPERPSPVPLVIAGGLVLACVALLPVWRPLDRQLLTPVGVIGDAPPAITAALRENARPGDRILNPQPWGSWFELALPANPIAIDSRIELFPVRVWDELDDVRTGTGDWAAQLASWNVRFVVATDEEDSFVARLSSSGWRVLVHDPVGTLLVAP